MLFRSRLIPDCIRAFMSQTPLVLRRPEAQRPWQHVLESLSGYLLLGSQLNQQENQEAWNFGPNEDQVASVETVVKQVLHLWGEGSYSIVQDRHLHEMTLLSLSNNKAKSRLHWSPIFSREEALYATVEWYKTWAQNPNQDMTDITQKQLLSYVHQAQAKGAIWVS